MAKKTVRTRYVTLETADHKRFTFVMGDGANTVVVITADETIERDKKTGTEFRTELLEAGAKVVAHS